MLRPDLLLIAEQLARSEKQQLSLDEIAEALGAAKVTSDEIEALFAWLEARGHEIGGASGLSASALLSEVLAVARRLRVELGRAPKEREIAEHSGLSLNDVRCALRFARTLQ